jgi:hypothetical protein
VGGGRGARRNREQMFRDKPDGLERRGAFAVDTGVGLGQLQRDVALATQGCELVRNGPRVDVGNEQERKGGNRKGWKGREVRRGRKKDGWSRYRYRVRVRSRTSKLES